MRACAIVSIVLGCLAFAVLAASIDNPNMASPRFTENDFRNYCHTHWFRSYVESIATSAAQSAQSNDQFWRTLFENARVKEKVASEIKSQLPTEAKNYLMGHVPSIVSKEVINFLPQFLSQNHQMHEILQKHAGSMETQLESRSRTILQKVTDDPNYHVINRAFFDAIDRRATDVISNTDKRLEKTVKTKMTAFDDQARQIQALQYETQSLKNSLWWSNAFSGTFLVGAIGAVAYFVQKNQ